MGVAPRPNASNSSGGGGRHRLTVAGEVGEVGKTNGEKDPAGGEQKLSLLGRDDTAGVGETGEEGLGKLIVLRGRIVRSLVTGSRMRIGEGAHDAVRRVRAELGAELE